MTALLLRGSEDSATSATSGAPATSTTEFRRRLGSLLGSRFGIDTRGLAAFRVALGLLVVGDLLFRARELRTFYTDWGVLPRSALAELFPTLATASLHTVSGSVTGQAVIFALAGGLAVLLAVGYRTRTVLVGVLLLHVSLYARNPYVLNGGDGLLIVALFLGVFLPLGERYAVDAVRRARAPRSREPRAHVTSLATATVLLQLVIVYVVNVPFKSQSDAWMAGNGVQYALELEQFSVFLGPSLTQYPALLTAVNWLWIGMMAASPLLILSTGRLRTAAVAGFVAAHAGMIATLRLGLFPFIVIAFLLLYLPPSAWNRLEALSTVASRPTGAGVRARIPGPIVSIPRSMADDSPTEVPPAVRRGVRVAATVVLAIVLVSSVAWPAAELGVGADSGADPVIEADGYVWTLFAPNTPTTTRWFVAPTTLESSERIDAFRGGTLEWEKPADAADTYPSALWLRYLVEMRFTSEREQRQLASHLCQRVQTEHGVEPTEVQVYTVEQQIPTAGGGEPERTELAALTC